MPKVLVEKQNLQDIANSIRLKTGSQNKMLPSQMSNEIDNIPTGSQTILQSKEVVITQNGIINITPDIGYDGLDEVEVTTNVPNVPNWSQLGYEGVPTNILNAVAYAKQIYDDWDNTITNVSRKFENDPKLIILPEVDTSNVTNFSYFCSEARGLFEVGLLDTSNATNFEHAFTSVAVKEFSFTDTSKVTNFNTAFGNNKVLVTGPNINTESGTNFSSMLKDCSNLQNVKVYDLSRATFLDSMFSGCSNLSNDSLNNIMEMVIGATSYNGTKTLRHIGLSSSQATICQTLSNWNALEQAGWTTGY